MIVKLNKIDKRLDSLIKRNKLNFKIRNSKGECLQVSRMINNLFAVYTLNKGSNTFSNLYVIDTTNCCTEESIGSLIACFVELGVVCKVNFIYNDLIECLSA